MVATFEKYGPAPPSPSSWADRCGWSLKSPGTPHGLTTLPFLLGPRAGICLGPSPWAPPHYLLGLCVVDQYSTSWAPWAHTPPPPISGSNSALLSYL